MPSRQDRRHDLGRRERETRLRDTERKVGRGLELEALEPRILLTTLVGGDVFEYIDADGQTIRVAVSGDTIAELIAADVDYNNEPVLGDMPGTWIDSLVGREGDEVLGGRGGERGILPVTLDPDDPSYTSIIDELFGAFSIGRGDPNLDNENLDIQALASQTAEEGGATFGFNLANVEYADQDRFLVQLVRVDTPDTDGDGDDSGQAYVDALLQESTLREDTTGIDMNLGNVLAFADDPTEADIGYALNTSGDLYRVNLIDGTANLAGDVHFPSGPAASDVQAMAVDDQGRVNILSAGSDGRISHLLRVDKLTGDVTFAERVQTVGENPVSQDFLGMTFEEDGSILAIAHTGDDLENTTLYRITVSGEDVVTREEVTTYEGVNYAGLTWARDINDEYQLVTSNPGSSQLIELSRFGPADETTFGGPQIVDGEVQGRAISGTNMVVPAQSLTTSTLAPGERPTLLTIHNNEIVRGSIASLQLGEEEALLDIAGAGFRPHTGAEDDGLLYFTTHEEFEVGGETHVRDVLHSIDVNLDTRSQVQNSLQRIGVIQSGLPEDVGQITSLAWEQTSDLEVSLWAFDTNRGTTPTDQDTGSLIEIDPDSAFITDVITVHDEGNAVTNLTGIEFVNDGPEHDSEFYAIRGGSEMLRIDRTGGALVLGPTPDADDDEGPVRGTSLQSLTWHDDILSPFTGDEGVLIATDTASDEVVFVDHRHRPQADAFSIYISQADENSSLAMAVVPPFDPNDPDAERPMQPFTGSTGSMNVLPVDGGDLITVGAPGGTGGVYIGAKSIGLPEELVPEPDNMALRPIIAGHMESFLDGSNIGTRPSMLDEFNGEDEDGNPLFPNPNVSAGIRVVESLLEFMNEGGDMGDRLMGRNLDRIGAMGVASDGTVAVIDRDRLDEGGDALEGYELALLNTGDQEDENVSPWVLIDAATGVPLTGVAGLDYADLDDSGREELYAMMETLDFRPTFDLGDLENGSEDSDFIALAVADEGQTLYGVAQSDTGAYELWNVVRTPTGEVDEEETTLLGEIVDRFGNAITDIGDIEIDSSGTLYVAGWSADAPIPSGSAGRLIQPDDVTLDQLREGAGIPSLDEGSDLRIYRGGTTWFDVDLTAEAGGTTDADVTLQDVLDAINNHADNQQTATFTFDGQPNDGDIIRINDGDDVITFEFTTNEKGDFPGGGGDGSTVRVDIAEDEDDVEQTLANFGAAIAGTVLDLSVEVDDEELILTHNTVGLANDVASIENHATNVAAATFFAVRARLNTSGDAIVLEHREDAINFDVTALSTAGGQIGLADGGSDGEGLFVGENMGVSDLPDIDVRGLATDPDDDSQMYAVSYNGASYDLYSLLRNDDGEAEEFSLEGRITTNGEVVLGIRALTSDGDGNFYFVGHTADQLNPTQADIIDLPELEGLGQAFDVVGLTGTTSDDLWLMEQDDEGAWYFSDSHDPDNPLAEEREYTNFLNLIEQSGQRIQDVLPERISGEDTGLFFGDNFGNDLSFLDLTYDEDGDITYAIAENNTAPLPNANIGGGFTPSSAITGTAVDADGTPFMITQGGSLIRLNQEPFEQTPNPDDHDEAVDGLFNWEEVTSTDSWSVGVGNIHGIVADVDEAGVFYVVGDRDGETQLFRITEGGGRQSLVELGGTFDLHGLAQDPVNTSHFYTVRHVGGESVLMRIDGGRGTTDPDDIPDPRRFEEATAYDGDPLDSFFSDEEVHSLAFNSRGDLVGIEGAVGDADRNLVVIDSQYSEGFKTGDLAAYTFRGSAEASVDSGLAGLALDRDTGRFFSANRTAGELWVSAPELYAFTPDINDDVVQAESYGAITFDDGGAIAVLGDYVALAFDDDDDDIVTVVRMDTNGDGNPDADILHEFDVPAATTNLQIDATRHGRLMYDPNPADPDADLVASTVVEMEFRGGELVAIDESQGSGNRFLIHGDAGSDFARNLAEPGISSLTEGMVVVDGHTHSTRTASGEVTRLFDGDYVHILVGSDLGRPVDLSEAYDVRATIEDWSEINTWFINHREDGVVNEGAGDQTERRFTNYLNLLDRNRTDDDQLLPDRLFGEVGTFIGDVFGNDLGIFDAAGRFGDMFTVADNNTAPLPNANIGGGIDRQEGEFPPEEQMDWENDDILGQVFGTTVDLGGDVVVAHFINANTGDSYFRLAALNQNQDGEVTGTDDYGRLQHEGNDLRRISGMVADVELDNRYYVIATDEYSEAGNDEMRLYQIDVNASGSIVDVQDVMGFGDYQSNEGELHGLAQDPNVPNHFYTVRHHERTDSEGNTEEVAELMRIDRRVSFESAAGPDGPSDLGQTNVSGLAFNERGDLVGLEGKVLDDSDSRHLIVVDREGSNGFRSDITGNTFQASEAGTIAPNVGDLAVDPDTGRFYAINEITYDLEPEEDEDGVLQPPEQAVESQLWVSTPQLWQFDADVSGDTTLANSLGTMTLDVDGEPEAILGDAVAITRDRIDGSLYVVMRQDRDGDGTTEDVLYHLETSDFGDQTTAMEATSLGEVLFDDEGTTRSARIVALTMTEGTGENAGGELVAIDESRGSDERMLIRLDAVNANDSQRLTDPDETDVEEYAQGLSTGASGRLVTIVTNPGEVSNVYYSTNQQELYEFDQSEIAGHTPGDDFDVDGRPLQDLDGLPLNADVTGLAVHPDTGQLYGVTQLFGRDHLVEIDTDSSPSFATVNVSYNPADNEYQYADGTNAEIRLRSEPVSNLRTATFISSMEFTEDGDLVALDDAEVGRRMIAIEDLTDPGNSTFLRSAPGFVDISEELGGLTRDSEGRFFSIEHEPVLNDPQPVSQFDPDDDDDELPFIPEEEELESEVIPHLWVSGNGLYTIEPEFDEDNPTVAQYQVPLLNQGRAITTTIHGLALDRASDTLRLVLHEDGESVLYSAGLVSGAVERDGVIRVDSLSTTVTDIALGLHGQVLVGAEADGDRLIAINEEDPYLSRQITAPGTHGPELAGLTIDQNNITYAIGAETDGSNHLYRSAGLTWAFGQVDVIQGEARFDAMVYLDPTEIEHVEAMAIHPSPHETHGSDVLIVGLDASGERNLFRLRPLTGEVSEIGEVDREIQSMTFRIGSGGPQLVGHDVAQGRLVDIDYTILGGGAGEVVVGGDVTTSAGSLRPTVGAIAYDALESRMLGADNATSFDRLRGEGSSIESAVLMEFVGTNTGAAMPQHFDRLFIGGTVTGQIHSAGSVDTLYAGWMPVGNTAGNLGVQPEDEPNFTIAGDLRNLVVLSSVGSTSGGSAVEPAYLTGFNMWVGGRVGQIMAGDDIYGAIEVENDSAAPGMSLAMRTPAEIEADLFHQRLGGLTIPGLPDEPDTVGEVFEDFMLAHAVFDNDNFDSPQRLGSYQSGIPGEPLASVVQGQLMGEVDDNVDYYSLPLMAGQTVTVQLEHEAGDGALAVGIFDPDGRLVYTDYDRHTFNEAFQFTADRPGEYRIAVAWDGDTNFNGGVDGGEAVSAFENQIPYRLRVEGVGDLAVGGVVADRLTLLGSEALRSNRGDLGAIHTNNNFSQVGGLATIEQNPDGTVSVVGPDSVRVEQGDLRSLSAGVFGVEAAGSTDTAYLPSVHVVDGSAGLLETRSGPLRTPEIRVGEDIQVIDAAVDLYGHIKAGGGIGIIRADAMLNELITPPSSIEINMADGARDNFIGLVDIAGDLVATQFIMNDGGNVHYMRVGGEAWSPLGGTVDEVHDPGRSVTLEGADGADVTFTPTLLGDEDEDETGDPINDHQLVTRFYPLIGVPGAASGGEVMIDVTSTGGIHVDVDSSLNEAYIGTLIVDGEGRAVEVEFDDDDDDDDDDDGDGIIGVVTESGEFDQADGDTDLNAIIQSSGNTHVNVLDIEGGDFTLIENRTGGDIVNLTANSVWNLRTRGSLGVTDTFYGAALVTHAGNSDFSQADTFPFVQQTTGIDIAENVYSIRSDAAVGNIHVGGDAFRIFANTDQSNFTDGRHEGINAPIYVQGNVDRVNIGQGLLPSGTGLVPHSGVYVDGGLQTISNDGQPAGSDIRGTVNAIFGIDTVRLNDGSIIDATISTLDPHEATLVFGGAAVIPIDGESTFETPIWTIDRIDVRGNGGIMGSLIGTGELNELNAGGFGLLSSEVITLGRIDSITADGLGIRDTVISARSSVGDVTATGDGELLDVLDFNRTARLSDEGNVFDPYTGKTLSGGNDLHEFLGTSGDESVIDEVTNAGLLRDIVLVANRTLDSISGYRLDASSPLVRNVIDFGGTIGRISTIEDIRDTIITGGDLDRFEPGGDVLNTSINIAGDMRQFRVDGDFGEGSVLNMSGSGAELNQFQIAGDMEGDLIVNGLVSRIDIGGDLIGSITITPPEDTRHDALRSFSLGGTMYEGSFNVAGDVGNISVAGSLGDPDNPDAAGDLTIEGDLSRLDVGRDRNHVGSVLAMDLTVLGDLRSLDVTGKITGDIQVTGDLNSVRVTADEATGENAVPVPDLAIGGLTDGVMDLFDVQAVTVGEDGQIYILHHNSGTGEHELYAVDRQGNGALADINMSLVGAIDDGSDPVDDVHAMEFNPEDGMIYLVGSAAGGNLTLFAFNPAVGATASAVGELRVNGSPLASSGNVSVRGLSFVEERREQTLYALTYDSSAEVSTLVTVDTTGADVGDATIIADVQIDGDDTTIAGMDTSPDRRGARLIAIDRGDDVGEGRVIEINLEDPTASIALSDPGTVSDATAGYASDEDGTFYAVQAGSVSTLVQSNHNLVEGEMQISGDLSRVSLSGGHLDGDITVGRAFGRLDIRDGDYVVDNTITVGMGDMQSLSIRDGDLHGDVNVQDGEIRSIMVNGSDIGGEITAGEFSMLRIDGSLLDTASIEVSGELGRLDVGGDVDAGAVIDAGAMSSANVRGSFAGELETGYNSRGTRISISEDFTGTIISNASDTRMDVRGDFGYDADGNAVPATLLVGRDLSSLRVDGDTVGQISVNGNARSMQFRGDLGDADNDSVITTGFSLDNFRLGGDMNRTLLQVGAGAGRDLTFGSGDSRELTRQAELGRFDANRVTDSVIAAGGTISSLRVNEGVADSSISAGMVVSTDAIADVIAGSEALNSEADRNGLRADVALYAGSFDNLQVNGDGVENSVISAGVDPVDGDFGTGSTVATTETGGQSGIRSLNLSSFDADSLIVTDSGVERQRIDSNDGTFEQIDYTVGENAGADDIASDLVGLTPDEIVDGDNALTLTVNGEQVTIEMRGDGEAEIYLDGGEIDTVVFRGTTDRTQFSVETENAGAVTINRMIAEDDATIGRFEMPNVNLGTTGDDFVDFWLDGEVNTLTFHAMAEDASWEGRIGGDVRSLEMDTQGSGRFVIGGEVSSLSIADSTEVSLLATITDVPTGPGDLVGEVQKLAVNQTGDGFYFDDALGLVQVDLSNGDVIEGPHDVVDSYTQEMLSLNGMDADDALLLATTETHSYQPVVNVGSMGNGHVSLQSLAADDDLIYAIENSGYYLIDDFDADFDEIVGTAIVSPDEFYMVNHDTSADEFELVRVDRSADGQISDTTIVGVITSEGDEVLDIDGLEYDTGLEQFLVVGNTVDGDPEQFLYEVDPETAEAEESGSLTVFDPSAHGLFVDRNDEESEILSALGNLTGLENVDISITSQHNPLTGAGSIGTYTNTSGVYGIGDGVILSTGDVADYESEEHEIQLEPGTDYGELLDAEDDVLLQAMLEEASGLGGADFFDVTAVTVSFDIEAGFDEEIFFDIAWGSMEYPEFVGSEFIDAFGMFINGENVAEVEVAGEDQPINVNNDAIAEIAGTRLNGVVAPDGDPLLRFSFDDEHVNATNNELTFIIGDTSDDIVDSTVYISGLGAEQTNPPDQLPGRIQGMAFRNNPNDPDDRSLYVVAGDPDGTRLFRVERDEDGQTIGAADLGVIEVDGQETDIRGISFDQDGRLIAQNASDGQTHRVLVNLADPTDSVHYSRPGNALDGADPTGIYSLGGGQTGDQILGVRNDGGDTQLYGFNAIPDRLVQIDPDSGARTVVGEFAAGDTGAPYFNSVEHIAFGPVTDLTRADGGGTLYALVSDRDGAGVNNTVDDGVALARIDFSMADEGVLSALNTDPDAEGNRLPALLDATADPDNVVPITDEFGGLAVSPTGIIYGVQKDGGDDVLVQIDTEATVNNALPTSELFTIELDGDSTDILGIGFDDQGRILGMNQTSGGNEIISINPADGTDVVRTTVPELLDTGLDAFAVNVSGTPSDTYAYDFDSAEGGTFYASPGVTDAPVLGQIDPTDIVGGEYIFTQKLPLLDEDEQLLNGRLIDMTVDEDADLVYSLTEDGRLYAHAAADGRFVASYGKVVSDSGDGALDIKTIEFDPDTGMLVGVDARFNVLVHIKPADAVDTNGDGRNDEVPAATLGENGSINAARIADIAYDESNGRLLGVTRGPNAVFGEFLDSSDATLGGLVARGFNRVDIETAGDRPYAGRLVATGQAGLSSVRIDGDFTGTLVSAGEVRRLDVSGDFGGTMQAWNDLNSVNVSGDVLAGSTIFTSDELRSLRVSDRDPVDFAGVLVAQTVGRMDVSGDVLEDASISVNGNLSSLRVGGDLDGSVEAGSLDRLDIRGDLGENGVVDVAGDLDSVQIHGDTASGSGIYAEGSMQRVTVRGTHEGAIASRLEMSSARFGDVDTGLIAAGTNLDNVQVDDLVNSVVSAGVWIGDDRIYNTADDVIFGGSITRSARVGGDMVASVIAAGVLPSMDNDAADGSPNLPLNTRAYVGYELHRPGTPSTFVDDAEAGGLLPSRISSLQVRGQVLSQGSAPVDGGTVTRESVIAAAGEIDRLSGSEIFKFRAASDTVSDAEATVRIYGDPLGAPTVENVSVVDEGSFEITFSEAMNTGSFILSQDNLGDGEVTGVEDLLGSITVRDFQTGEVLNDLDLVYELDRDDRGRTNGVLTVHAPDGFDGRQIEIELSGGGDGEAPAIFDRSGGRSILRNITHDPDHTLEAAFGGDAETQFDVDPYGTILDGDRNGQEGGDARYIQVITADDFVQIEDPDLAEYIGDDVDDTFEDALETGPFMDALEDDQDYSTLQIGSAFTSITDVDVYNFNANAYDFFSADLEADVPVTLGIFLRDHQGDPDSLESEEYDDLLTVDDTFELVTRYEFDAEGSAFQAVELPSLEVAEGSSLDMLDGVEDGRQTEDLDFFVVVAPYGFGGDVTGNPNYELTFNMASSDVMLDGQDNGQVDLPEDEQIGYFSHELASPGGERGNLLGFNDPKQLVYLNFDGGVSDRMDMDGDGIEDVLTFDAFEASVLDPSFADIALANEALIEGGEFQSSAVQGIVPSILDMFRDTPENHPFGQLNVELIDSAADFDLLDSMDSGIFFTTLDPELHTDMVAGEDFGTMFIGEPDTPQPGLYGQAQDVDIANMNKGLDAVIPTSSFSGDSFANSTADRLNEYSRALSNVIAHELGHTLGLNHHGSLFGNDLIPDSPTNDPDNTDEPILGNLGISTMGSGPTSFLGDQTGSLWQFGTASITPNEFPIGHIDHVDQLLRWFTTNA